MELNDVGASARTAEIGSVSGAARSLGLPKSTVSRALTRLEADIGALLIDRSTRHLRLTDAGMLFHPYATRPPRRGPAPAPAISRHMGYRRASPTFVDTR
ncbi:LysR family transcriptional regulator (plasmid) [Polymorphobacter sp. PAMC 29334]|uniref:LysR family transcriptional regulator n=1 Tax=Polymorphobacter sp. PAMC 29334 TaxID=2862331 RepID=UPI001C663CFA|nr:LysR family transcriptional regulator [Polymorphobacter sp. PAMC 29334]